MKGSRRQKEARFGSPHLLKSRGRGHGVPAWASAPKTPPFTIGVASAGLTTPQIERSLERMEEEGAWLEVEQLFSWFPGCGDRVRQLMARPTVGEIKRVLALDELGALRAEINAGVVKARQVAGEDDRFAARLDVLRNLACDEQVKLLDYPCDAEPFSKAGFVASFEAVAVNYVVAPIWLSELAQTGVAEKLAARAADMDAVLPPPAPATPSTRGRF